MQIMLTPIAANIHVNPMIADRSLSRSHRRSHEKYNRHTNIAAFMIVATMRSMDAIIGNVLIAHASWWWLLSDNCGSECLFEFLGFFKSSLFVISENFSLHEFEFHLAA